MLYKTYHLGENYTYQVINNRICYSPLNKRRILYEKPKFIYRTATLKGSFKQAKKLTGYRALYFYFLYRLGMLPKNKPRPPCNPILWEDVRKLRQYTEQTRLICKNKIDSVEQLQSFIKDTKGQIEELTHKRNLVRNKLRRAKDPEVIQALKLERNAITMHIAPLRNNLKIAFEIEKRSIQMKEKLAFIRQLEMQERQEIQKREIKSKQRGWAR